MCKIGTFPNNSSKYFRMEYISLLLVICEMRTCMHWGMADWIVSPPTSPQTMLTTSRPCSPLCLSSSFSDRLLECVYSLFWLSKQKKQPWFEDQKKKKINLVSSAIGYSSTKLIYHVEAAIERKIEGSPTGFVDFMLEAVSIMLSSWCSNHRGSVNKPLHGAWSNATLHNALYPTNCSFWSIA